jgi:uncharacterized oligopeptide transporter (OPT) family protein
MITSAAASFLRLTGFIQRRSGRALTPR